MPSYLQRFRQQVDPPREVDGRSRMRAIRKPGGGCCCVDGGLNRRIVGRDAVAVRAELSHIQLTRRTRGQRWCTVLLLLVLRCLGRALPKMGAAATICTAPSQQLTTPMAVMKLRQARTA